MAKWYRDRKAVKEKKRKQEKLGKSKSGPISMSGATSQTVSTSMPSSARSNIISSSTGNDNDPSESFSSRREEEHVAEGKDGPKVGNRAGNEDEDTPNVATNTITEVVPEESEPDFAMGRGYSEKFDCLS